MTSPTSIKRASATKAGARSQAHKASQADSLATMPSSQDIEKIQNEIRSFCLVPAFERFRTFASRLAQTPPQVILLEGGNAQDRRLAALYWTTLLNCSQKASHKKNQTPCFACQECIRLLTYQHRDIFFLDGSLGTIKIDDVREIRSVIGEPPREARYRVIIFYEAQSLMEAAANALLKSLEEPRTATSFLLLAPQRERLLPTLVSRSTCLTLPWPFEARENDALVRWEALLCAFFQTGKNLFSFSGAKGELTAHLVHEIIERIKRALTKRILSEQTGVVLQEGLESSLRRISYPRLRIVDEVLAESQDSLIYMVNPSLVLEWLATRLYLLMQK